VIHNGAVSNRDDTNRFIGLGELVDDAKGTDAQQSEAPQPAAQRVAGQRIAFEQPERVLEGIDEGPVELE
jgi:hypothetical protein